MNRKWKTFTLLTAVAALPACTAGGPPKPSAAEIRAHCDQLYSDQRLDPIRDKVVLPIAIGDPQPVDVLAKRVKATEQEKQAVLVLSSIFERCNEFAAKRVGEPPAYRATSNVHIVEGLADLYAGDISYGQFAKSLLYIGERDKLARQQLDDELKSREKWRILHDYNGN